MKQIITLTLLLIPFAAVFSQSQEELKAKGYVPCSQEHTDPNEACYVLMPKNVRPVHEIVSSAKAGNDPFACQPRPLRTLIVYDIALLDQHDSVHLDSTIRKNAHKLINTFNNSNLQHRGVDLWIRKWDIPEYSTIFDIVNMLANSNDNKLDSLMMLKNQLLDIDQLTVVSVKDADGFGVATQMNSQFFNWEQARGVVNFQSIELNSITYAHECGHRLGCGHEGARGNGVDSNAQAYINDSLKVHSAMKGANRLSREVEVFSGPNSWAVSQQGDTVHFWDGYRNNARYAQMILEAYWCDNKVTQVLIDTSLCGSGQLRAITNNADSFIWQVVSGDIDLQAENDTLVDYIAHEESVVRVIGQKTGKLYADTAYMTVPARQQIQIDTTMTQGDTLSDGTIVTQSGTYVVTELDENGCEVIITYNVELSTSVTSFHEAGISLYPNPANEQIHLSVNNLEYEILNVAGQAVQRGMMEDHGIRIQDLFPGMYFLQVHKDQGVYQARFVKE